MTSVDFLGVPLIAAGTDELAEWVLRVVRQPPARPALLVHGNCHNLHCFSYEPDLRQRLGRRASVFFEGVALKVAALLARRAWLPDSNGTDAFPMVLAASAPQGLSVFLLGGEATAVARASRAIAERWPHVEVRGSEPGYFAQEAGEDILRRINQARPDILLLGLGSPYQERLALAWSDRLQVRMVWAVGGLFDTLSGCKPRAPLWIRRARLEWLFRLAREPRRLWRRTFVSVPWLALQTAREVIGRT